jgi:hypothetical protein
MYAELQVRNLKHSQSLAKEISPTGEDVNVEDRRELGLRGQAGRLEALRRVGPEQRIDLAIEDCINSAVWRLRACFFGVKSHSYTNRSPFQMFQLFHRFAPFKSFKKLRLGRDFENATHWAAHSKKYPMPRANRHFLTVNWLIQQ